jgi:DNA-binding Lrp family transcriptional regulator
MRTLDETDVEILRLLSEDARRSYREIADAVGLSPPSVSDRVDRLQEVGVIRRFTLDLDRSTLRGGVPVLVELSVRADAVADVREALALADGVEHVFTAADPRVFFQCRLPGADVRTFLTETLEPAARDAVTDYDVVVLTSADWTPRVGGTDLAATCAQCGNDVDEDGELLRRDGDVYYLCCATCLERFESRYDRFEADS